MRKRDRQVRESDNEQCKQKHEHSTSKMLARLFTWAYKRAGKE